MNLRTEGLPQSGKPLVTFKNRKARLDFDRKIKGSLPGPGIAFLREEYEEGKEQLMIQSISHHLSNMAVLLHEHVWLPVELGHWCLLMM